MQFNNWLCDQSFFGGSLLVETRVRSRRVRRRGFSLTELMVVMVILGMLATATALAVNGMSDKARRSRVITDISVFEKAIDSYYAETGRFPTTDEGLAILAVPAKNSRYGYVKKVNKDPWGNPYQYSNPGTKGPYEIVSFGADGKEGGVEINADISSENLDNG